MVGPNEMNIIDFSTGIRSEEIQHNFQVLSEQIAQERLAIAGHGVSQGLDLVINGFDLTVEAGSLIDVNGGIRAFETKQLKIALPRMVSTSETKSVAVDGVVLLANTPYATTGLTTSQYATKDKYGVRVTRFSNQAAVLEVLACGQGSVTIKSGIVMSEEKVIVTYSHTNRRYDTIYINENYEIAVAEGLTSSSPSAQIPAQYKYILGFVLVDPFAQIEGGIVIAKVSVKTDLRQLRNLYTDDNNQLFICGIPFSDLQIIHMAEPVSPAENTLWYDGIANKLKVWKNNDGIQEWVYVNDTNFIPVMEYKIWTPEENPYNRQDFLFEENELNLRFMPGKNELEVLIGQTPLHSDQFEEIVAQDADGEYENIGIGFRLVEPLDRDDYVEVRVTHRVNDGPLKRRFQRSATFVATGTHTYIPANGKKMGTSAPYRKGENQLEVFVEGRRLLLGIDFVEATDLALEAQVGSASREFEILSSLSEGAIVAYKITTSVFSYDNVDGLLGDLDTRLDMAEAIVQENVDTVTQMATDTTIQLGLMNDKLVALENAEAEHTTFLKKTDAIVMSNLSTEVAAGIGKGPINLTLTKLGTVMQDVDLMPEDFVIMFDMQRIGGNSIVRRGVDYEIRRMPDGLSTYIEFLTAEAVPDGNMIYLTGIRF